MKWHAYSRGPIDHWFGWEPYEEPAGAVPSRDELRARPDPPTDDQFTESLLYEMYAEAQKRFPKLGWEGDGIWYSAGIPAEDSGVGPDFVLAVKQENNGTVFVLSPVALPHLDD